MIKLASIYNQQYYEEHEFSYTTEDRADIKRILKLFSAKRSERVLEVGCGLGILLSKIPAKKKIGVEINDFAIQKCRERGLSVIKAYAEKLPFENASFDVVIMNEVLSHLKKPELALKEAFRILSPRGNLIVTSPVKSVFFHNISQTHIHEMTIKELRAFIQKSGFTIKIHEVCGISFLYPILEGGFYKPFRFLRKMLNKRNREKNKSVQLLDSYHGLADKIFLKPLNIYRNYLLEFGLNQLVVAQKKPS